MVHYRKKMNTWEGIQKATMVFEVFDAQEDTLDGLCFDRRENLYLAGGVGGRSFRHDNEFYFTDFKGTLWDSTGGIYNVSECIYPAIRPGTSELYLSASDGNGRGCRIVKAKARAKAYRSYSYQ